MGISMGVHVVFQLELVDEVGDRRTVKVLPVMVRVARLALTNTLSSFGSTKHKKPPAKVNDQDNPLALRLIVKAPHNRSSRRLLMIRMTFSPPVSPACLVA